MRDDQLLELLDASFPVVDLHPPPASVVDLRRAVAGMPGPARRSVLLVPGRLGRWWAAVVAALALALGGSGVAVATGLPAADPVAQLASDIGLPVQPPALRRADRALSLLRTDLSGGSPSLADAPDDISSIEHYLSQLTPDQRAGLTGQTRMLIAEACRRLQVERPGEALPEACPAGATGSSGASGATNREATAPPGTTGTGARGSTGGSSDGSTGTAGSEPGGSDDGGAPTGGSGVPSGAGGGRPDEGPPRTTTSVPGSGEGSGGSPPSVPGGSPPAGGSSAPSGGQGSPNGSQDDQGERGGSPPEPGDRTSIPEAQPQPQPGPGSPGADG